MDINYDTPKLKKSKHSGEYQRSAMDICGEAGFLLSGFHSKFATAYFNQSWCNRTKWQSKLH